MVRSKIVGTGSAVPEKILTNFDLERIVDTSDDWITTRTGIKERRIASAGEYTSTFATAAAVRALSMAGIEPAALDLIIVATVTPDFPFPATACLIQD
ncbi:MAG TPA: 3-oxoacyl-ACP synthase, partial [Geobacteraceae bacterium]|nr:3-oxoacyl-ACP synthase [Geobacteraceae bacterium]